MAERSQCTLLRKEQVILTLVATFLVIFVLGPTGLWAMRREIAMLREELLFLRNEREELSKELRRKRNA